MVDVPKNIFVKAICGCDYYKEIFCALSVVLSMLILIHKGNVVEIFFNNGKCFQMINYDKHSKGKRL